MPGFVFATPAKINNKFGISLLQPTNSDIKKAAEMVNSKGGDYGYVTLVIQENDRNHGKWQEVFDELRKYHLIPIVRLATKPEGENWRRPSKDDVENWTSFLDKLNWVVKERYIVLFNEPNHASEWGGEVDASTYGEIVQEYSTKLHAQNKDFFVMMAGFDSSAPSSPSQYEDEDLFIKQVVDSQPSIFNNIDGWVSHSYPNPGFSGSPWDTGRKSIRGYEWELQVLKNNRVEKNLPVFITETGWIDNKLSRQTIASYYENAFNDVWLSDERVVAVTPFVFNYQTEPFLGFSFKQKNSEDFYPQYETLAALSKTKGEPVVLESGILEHQLPKEFVSDSSFRFSLKLKNTGQAVWDKDAGYQLVIIGDQQVPFEYFFSDIKDLEPFKEIEISLFLKTNKTAGVHTVKIALQKNKETIAQTESWSFTILPIPSLEFKTTLLPKFIANSNNVEIQIYDDKEGLIYKKGGLSLKGGKGTIEEVQNIVFGKKYRIVILAPYYLPRQNYLVFHKEKNSVTFKTMLPFDLNKDGKWGFNDFGELLGHPNLFGLFVP